MGRQLGSLRGNHAVDVQNLIASLAHQIGHGTQQHQGIGALVGRVGVGEKLADVAAANGAQQGIGNRMSQNIGIGVAKKPQGMGYFHAAQDQLAAFYQSMDVIAQADTQPFIRHRWILPWTRLP